MTVCEASRRKSTIYPSSKEIAAMPEVTAIYYGVSVALTIGGLVGTYVRTLHGRINSVERDLSQHKLESAEKFVTAKMLELTEVRITEAINRLGDRLDRSFERNH